MPPPDVLRPDGDDPYLVVAADKGTATFSDIANGIALERGFWLGDAFASGGSVGYDHKKMGITARGAWEAVKRHFRELGTDIQSTDFTVIGVGDMSGDVFGNGMLLSRHIRLVAAFDHRHIFLDPNADAATGFAERERLFDLPRSSWDDYNKSKIGQGGGVFARSLKEIPLSPDVKALIGSDKDRDVAAGADPRPAQGRDRPLWFGGIGTYIKASTQSNLEVGDRANDAMRINGSDIHAKVVGEGANLGVTQLGRIEYAKSGGRIDTDAVDNSAGVDTSDHEVNLKILLGGPVMRGEIHEDKRNRLLAAMTDDVAAHVLADNYNQTLALSVAQLEAARDLDSHGRFMRDLEQRGKLDRAVEFLPSDAQLKTLAKDGKGLTRPELCGAAGLCQAGPGWGNPGQPPARRSGLRGPAGGLFPAGRGERFPQEPERHRLKREIVSTVLTNRIVNLAGPVFVLRTREVTGLSAADVARAFVLGDGAFGLSALKARIDALDGKSMPVCRPALQRYRRPVPARQPLVPHPCPGERDAGRHHRALSRRRRGPAPELCAGPGRAGRITTLAVAGVPEDLARDLVLLAPLSTGLDVVLLAQDSGSDAGKAGALYFAIGGEAGPGSAARAGGTFPSAGTLGPAGPAPPDGRSVGRPARHCRASC